MPGIRRRARSRTMWSRSTSVSASILCVTCSVNSEKPTARSKVPAASQSTRRAARQQPAVGAPPEPHVVALGGVARHLLLVGEVLLPSEQEQRAHRRLVVAAAGERVDVTMRQLERERDRRRRASSRPRRIAACRLLGLAEQREVHGVAEQAVARAGAADEVVGHVDRRSGCGAAAAARGTRAAARTATKNAMPHQPNRNVSVSTSHASHTAARPAKTKKNPSRAALSENRRVGGSASTASDAATGVSPMSACYRREGTTHASIATRKLG